MSYEEEKQDRKIEQLEAEIERLRSLNPFGADVRVGMRIRDNAFAYSDGEGAAVLQNSLLAKDSRIKELEALRSDILGVIRRPKTTSDKGLILYLKELDEYNIRATKRVGDLEDALVEKQTALMPSAPRCYADARRQAAIEQLRAEGKIGPDASKPRSWQITDERKAALKRLYGLLVIRYKYSYPDETETLRAMLEADE